MDALVEPLTLRLRRSLRAAHGDTTARELLLLRLEADDGTIGWGEAAPLESYDGVSVRRCTTALERHVAVLREGAGMGGAALLDACREADDLPQALAAVDMALWDAAGRREGRPVSALIADDPLLSVPVNATIGAEDRAGAANSARDAAAAGFPCVKVKVGVGDDAGRVAAVRAALGPDVALRLDANGAWDVDEAVAAIGALAPAGIELVEEPVHGSAALRAVRERVATRIAMDETCAELGALASGAADAVCLKLGRAGGIGGLLNGTTPSAALIAVLGQDRDRYTWVAATVGSNNAAGYQLATGDPVMAIGGFNGTDPAPTLAQFQAYVATGRIHWFVGGAGVGGSTGTAGQIAAWVAATFQPTSVGGTTLYDLTLAR